MTREEMLMDPLNLVLAMAEHWTDPVVCRDAPARVPHVITQLIEHCEALQNALLKIRAHTSAATLQPDLHARLLGDIERIADEAINSWDK